MWQRFTERARRVVFYAQEEAKRLGENRVWPEHILLGLVREPGPEVESVLGRMGVPLDALQAKVLERLTIGPGPMGREMELTPRARRVIDLAYNEARTLNNNYIGTEHLLLGLIRLNEGVMAEVFAELGVTMAGASVAGALDCTHTAVTVALDNAHTAIEKMRGIVSEASAPAPEVKKSASALSLERSNLMWQRFTERARKVVFYAQEEAGKLGENYVSTEHLLLGLVRENDSVAARILDRMGVSLQSIREEIERQVSRGDGRLGQDMQLTPRAKRVIDLAYEEARQLTNNYIGTEHLLLGLIREGEGLAGRALSKLDVDLDRARREVMHLQSEEGSEKGVGLSPMKRILGAFQKAPTPAQEAASGKATPINQLCDAVLQQAITEKADKVLFEPTEKSVRISLAVGGFWREAATVPDNVQFRRHLARQLKSMGGLNVDEAQTAQHGQGLFRFEEQNYVLQVFTAPSEAGETVTVHIQPVAQEEARPVGKPSQRMAAPKGPSPIAFILEEHRLRGCDILGIEQLTREEILLVLGVASRLKANKFDATQTQFASGQTLALLFEKPSLRTRVTFEAGMNQMGGHAIYLEGRLGQRETVPDVARNLDRWLDGIMARTFAHETVLELAEFANIPVINGLSDREHPCQAFADFQTLAERKGELAGLKLAYVGDGNNVAHSLMLLAAKIGTHFSLSCPVGYEPDSMLWQTALEAAQETGAVLTLTHDPHESVADADAVYTDVWASMGQEEEAAERAHIFAPFQVNTALMAGAKPEALVMHCLPAHRGEEITTDVIEGPHSVVFDQAENRLHAQKAVLALVL